MMKKTIMILMAMMLIATVSAVGNIGEVKQNNCIDLYNYCPSCSYINLTAIQYPNGTVETMNTAMTKSGNNFQEQFCNTGLLGKHYYTTCGDKQGIESCEEMDFTVTSQGYSEERGITEVTIFIVLLIAVLIFVYIQTSKLIGSIGIMVTGLAVLFKVPEHGWIGWLIFASGFIMVLYTLLSKPKKRRLRYRRR